MARTKSEDTTKFVKKIPTTENGETTHCLTASKQEYFITQNLVKMRFTLWKKVPNGYEMLGTAKSPLDFNDKIPWQK